MKKILLFVAIVVCSIVTASAQISEGESTLSAKLGVGGSYGIPVTITYENALWGINSESCVTLGGTLGFGVSDDSSHLLIGLRSAYHYAINAWDLSGALTLGANTGTDSGLLLGLNVGASYYFSEHWAASAEVGFGVSNFCIGATYKF